MKCLTKTEVDQWLDDNSVIAEPYGKHVPSSAYLQFRCPSQYLVLEAFIRNFLSCLPNESGCLIDIVDWSSYQPSQMLVVEALRSKHNESRWVIDASGHSLTENERELTIGLFSLTTDYQWSSYLYFPEDIATLHNWEGDLYDFWTREEHVLEFMKTLIGTLGLEITSA